MANGPLAGVRVLEMPSIGPGPYCGMLLADWGADVLRLDRVVDAGLGLGSAPAFDLLGRGKRSLALDLKATGAIDTVLGVIDKIDVIIEGFRPGTMERLGLGPDVALARNPRLVYGRMTGWGQEGPLAMSAAHDINYLSLTGVLHAIGPRDGAPVPPLNLLADFGGGAQFLACGILSALFERERSGKGQIIDAAMVDGAANLMTVFYGMMAEGSWKDQRESNILDGAAPFYRAYRCADGEYISIGPIEEKFFRLMLDRLGIDSARFPNHNDRACWAELGEAFEQCFLSKDRDEWCALLENTDVCFAPILSMTDAPQHPHMKARGAFVEVAGITQPGPAPRLSRTPSVVDRPPPRIGEGGQDALREWGVAVG